MTEPTGTAATITKTKQEEKKLLRASRLSVVETVYHQQMDGTGSSTSSTFDRWLDTDDNPYVRTMFIGEEWQLLDTGWLEKSSMLMLHNKEVTQQQKQPTAEEQQLAASRIIEVGILVDEPEDPRKRTMLSPPRKNLVPFPCWIIRPNESSRIEPVDPKKFHVRCRNGKAKLYIVAVPN